MKVAQKRQEIKIMRLLGATPWFIRGPFIIEGGLYGMVSALVSWCVLSVALLYLTPILVAFTGDIPVLPVPYQTMLGLLGGSMSVGFLMGTLSGSLSTSRY